MVPATNSVQGVKASPAELVTKIHPGFSTMFSTDVLKTVGVRKRLSQFFSKTVALSTSAVFDSYGPVVPWPSARRAIVSGLERHHLSSALNDLVHAGQEV
jgi:hypothetical protein